MDLFHCNATIMSINYKSFHAEFTKMFICFKIVYLIEFTAHFSAYKHDRENASKSQWGLVHRTKHNTDNAFNSMWLEDYVAAEFTSTFFSLMRNLQLRVQS